jgi:hypothetical protein
MQAIKPSTIFPNKSARLFRQFEVGAVVEKAHQTFKEKTYLERYKSLYSAANLASFLFQTLSALFAFTFGQHLVVSVLPQFGETFVLFSSCFLAALLLIGLEVFKRLCLGSFVVSFIQSRSSQSGSSVSWAALAVNVCLIGVAVYTSTEGAKEFTRKQTDKSETIKGKYAGETENVTATIQSQIDGEKKSLADFKRSVSWKGKINMGEKNTAFTIASHNRRLEKLQDEKEKALASIGSGLQSDLSENAAKTAKDSGNMFWVSLVVELAGLLCIGYVFFYLSRVFIENGVSGGGGDKPNDQQEDELHDLISSIRTNGAATVSNSASPVKNPIGFRRYDDQASEKDKGAVQKPAFDPVSDLPFAEMEQMLGKYPSLQHHTTPSGFSVADLQGYLRKYQNVVKCLEEGLSNKQVAKRCKVSETTVHNVKRVLRNLGNGKLSVV